MGLLATIFLAMGSRGVLSEATGQSLKPLMPTQITKNSEEWNSVTILQGKNRDLFKLLQTHDMPTWEHTWELGSNEVKLEGVWDKREQGEMR